MQEIEDYFGDRISAIHIIENEKKGVVAPTISQVLKWLKEEGVKECDTIVKGIIRWRQGGFILEVIENDFENAGYYSISALYTDTESDVEIIGNIYDTPELIKEEEK